MKKSTLLGRFLIWRVRHISNRNFLLILSVVVGVAAGLTALILKTAVFYLRQWLVSDNVFDFHNYLLLIYPAMGIALTVFMRKYVIKRSSKHNITAILEAISKRNSQMDSHKIYSSMLGGTLTAGFGGSIGLESPIISSGAAIGSTLGKFLHLNFRTITVLLACGASGAIAAIFNTPIAAVVFALEVLMIDLSRFSLVPLLMASTSGAITTKVLFDTEILFGFTVTDAFVSDDIPFFMLFAVISGLMAFYFTRFFIYIERRFEQIRKVRYRLLAGTIALGVIIFIFPPLFGEGFETIKSVLSGNYENIFNNSLFGSFKDSTLFVILFFSLLAFLKVFATAVTMGSGGIGGIFAPSLFTGALSGFLFAHTINALDIGIQLSESNFALVGMASMLAGVLHAPLTGMFLIAEVTSGYHLIVPLMLTATLSYIIAKYLSHESIITYQLAKKGDLITHNKDKAVLKFMRLKSVIETDFKTVPVSATLADLVKIVAHSHRNIFPVISPDNVLVGIILLDDIREIMFDQTLYNTTLVKNLMHLPPSYIETTDTMEQVMEKFRETNAWNLPVIDGDKYVGFVSKSKMFSVYRNWLMQLSYE